MNNPCSVDGCDNRPHARGLCGKHYLRWRRYSDVSVVFPVGPSSRRNVPCTVEDCRNLAYSKTVCKAHYHRLLKYGSPTGGGPLRPRGATILRLMERVDQTGDCWLWTGCVGRDGYGSISIESERRTDLVHRIAYRHFIGPIPDGLEIDHVCHGMDPNCRSDNHCPHRRCVKPDHLEAVTHAENVLRSWEGRR